MKKFMVIYHAPADLMKQAAKSTPEEQKEGMKPWLAWQEKCGEGLVDIGNPLAGGQKVLKSGGLAPSDKEVVGYSILQADDMAGVVDMLKSHPHLEWDDACEMEVHEMMPLPGS